MPTKSVRTPTAEPPPTEQEHAEELLSPRARLRQWFETRIDGLDTFDLGAISQEACTQFSRDPAWTTTMLSPLVRQYLRELIGQLRPHDAVLGETVTSRGSRTMEERADALARKWGNWLESTGTGYVRLLSMTKPQLLAVAQARTTRGTEELRMARLFTTIAERLEDDDQTVQDCFTVAELETIETRLRQEGV